MIHKKRKREKKREEKRGRKRRGKEKEEAKQIKGMDVYDFEYGKVWVFVHLYGIAMIFYGKIKP